MSSGACTWSYVYSTICTSAVQHDMYTYMFTPVITLCFFATIHISIPVPSGHNCMYIKVMLYIYII